VRAYPMHWALAPHDPALRDLALACGELGVPLVLTVRFEDLRQRHALDVAGDLTAAHVRALARAGNVRLVVTGAGRELLEESHWGLTPEEQQRVHWDFAWIWGPPEEQLAHLFHTIGPDRFVYGTHWPLRLTQSPRANLDLLPLALRERGITDARSLAPIRKTPT
jgi:predicted TIM-barrel fold metal-dependent hydrolase